MQHTESSIQIYFSSDHSRFKMITGNRQLNDTKIKRIIKDIEAGIDVLKYYPIQVVEKDGRLEIMDGQHRFYIAKKLKRPVHYIILKDQLELTDIAKINSNTEKWKTKDFINCYMEQGNKNYLALQDFMDQYGLSATLSVKLLETGNPGTESGLDSSRFHRGLFEVKQLEVATEIAEACKRFSSFPYWKDRGFVIAVYRIIKAGLTSIDELVEKYKKYPDTLTKQSGFKNYIFVLESLYNKGKQSRVVIY